MRHWSLMRMLYCPVRLPRSFSRRLPGNACRSSSDSAASSRASRFSAGRWMSAPNRRTCSRPQRRCVSLSRNERITPAKCNAVRYSRRRMPTIFGQINLFVADMDATVAFYRLLELDVPDPFEWPAGSGAQHVEVHTGGACYLAFDNHPQARIWNAQFDPDRGAGNIVVGLLVDTRPDVDRLYAKVKAARHPVGQGPYDAFWGSRYAIVIDPDGNQVGLKSPANDRLGYEPTGDWSGR